jgi:hypothetical protein
MRVALRKDDDVAGFEPHRSAIEQPAPAGPSADDVIFDQVMRIGHHVGDVVLAARCFGNPRIADIEIEEDRSRQPDRAKHLGERIGAHIVSAPRFRTSGQVARTVEQGLE